MLMTIGGQSRSYDGLSRASRLALPFTLTPLMMFSSRDSKGQELSSQSGMRSPASSGPSMMPEESTDLKERSQIQKEIDIVHSKIIHARGDRCVTCGSTESLQCSHFFSKGSTSISVRWDLHPAGNCHLQCATCHFEHDHQSRSKYERWFIEEHGQAAFNELRRRANGQRHLFDHELLDMLAGFTAEYEEL